VAVKTLILTTKLSFIIK